MKQYPPHSVPEPVAFDFEIQEAPLTREFYCATKGCFTVVAGMYCDPCRKNLALQKEQAVVERSERMKKMWEEHGDEMRAAAAARRKKP